MKRHLLFSIFFVFSIIASAYAMEEYNSEGLLPAINDDAEAEYCLVVPCPPLEGWPIQYKRALFNHKNRHFYNHPNIKPSTPCIYLQVYKKPLVDKFGEKYLQDKPYEETSEKILLPLSLVIDKKEGDVIVLESREDGGMINDEYIRNGIIATPHMRTYTFRQSLALSAYEIFINEQNIAYDSIARFEVFLYLMVDNFLRSKPTYISGEKKYLLRDDMIFEADDKSYHGSNVYTLLASYKAPAIFKDPYFKTIMPKETSEN